METRKKEYRCLLLFMGKILLRIVGTWTVTETLIISIDRSKYYSWAWKLTVSFFLNGKSYSRFVTHEEMESFSTWYCILQTCHFQTITGFIPWKVCLVKILKDSAVTIVPYASRFLKIEIRQVLQSILLSFSLCLYSSPGHMIRESWVDFI